MRVTPLQSISLLAGGTGMFFALEIFRGNPKFYSNLLMPSLHSILPAETAHNLAVKMIGSKFTPRSRFVDPECLHTCIWGRQFSNPLGIAAGFDKHAQAMQGLDRVGFGFIEVGSVTPLPQVGNPKPRVFRLSEDEAVINRYGFNSCGHAEVMERLEKWRKQHSNVILGVNLGKNKTSTDHIADYTNGVRKLGRFADYIVINVSSPNTPGLRQLQNKEYLKDLSMQIHEEVNKLSRQPRPITLIKLAPDLNSADMQDIATIAMQEESGIDGLIISNTTIQRPDDLKSKHRSEIGGLSGPPLKALSTDMIRRMYQLTKGTVPIVGVGGISTGEDAYEKIQAGASLVQMYTSLIYHGPPVVSKIKSELSEILIRDGFSSVNDAVGVDHK